MTLFFYIIIGLITFVAFLHAWSRKDYDVSRTIMIKRPKAEVYGYVRQLQKQPFWMPWFLNDPEAVWKFKGEDGKEGAAAYWKGTNKVEGIQKITKVRDGKILESQILFLKPYKSLSLSYMAVKEVEPGSTKIVWGLKGVHRFPASVLMLFYGMDRAVGRDFETGLYNLKTIMERK